MKIIAATRTRNEARNIDRFCRCYAWVDQVLVSDGGSDDDTIERALTYPNVLVRSFEEREYRNGLWRNPHGKHLNYLIAWARAEGADWLILDDTDCVPSVNLQEELGFIMETIDQSVIMLYRLYVWGDEEYFPDMSLPGQSLYAWRMTMPIIAWEGNPFSHRLSGWSEADVLRLEHPFACLHFFFPDEETVKRKKEWREGIGIHEEEPHPLTTFGPLKALPDWARV